jgi:hypothetical protein
MWSSIKSAAQRAIPFGPWIQISGTILAITLAFPAVPSGAAPVQYVRFCSLYGPGFFYIPGTDTCLDTHQITANQFAIDRQYSRAATGIAMTTSLVTPYLPNGTNYAISGNWGGFDGKNAIGIAGMIRLRGNLVFSVGFAAGLDAGRSIAFSERTQTEVGTVSRSQSWSEIQGLGRAGFQYAW